jgi:hypothetical protein
LGRALFAILLAGCAAGQASTDPFVRASSISVPETRLWSSAPYWITDGDFVHPAFSPAGTQLAYSDVLVEDSTEGTALFVNDLAARTTRSLLNREAAQQYAAYKVFTSDLSWPEPRRIRITLADGDVGSSILDVDPANGAILSDSFYQGGDGDSEDFAPPLAALRDSLHSAFPDLPVEVLTSALEQPFVEVPGRGVIIQKNYAHQDDNIWLLDLHAKRAYRLLDPGVPYALGGGVAVGSTTLILVSRKNESFLFAITGDAVPRPLARINCNTWRPSLDVKASTESFAILRVMCHHTYARGNNPIFTYTSSHGLRQSADVSEAYDLALSSSFDLLAIVAWEGARRRIGIGSMARPH